MPFQHPQSLQEFFGAVTGAGEKKVFVQVSAEWCGPCQLIKDDMATLAEDLAETYVFVYADVEKMEEVADTFECSTMPTFLIFKGPGAPIGRYEGGKADKIREFAVENKDK
uniref:Thioredoxin domain-containing protein n=2 Tax=Choreotrichia TaxID=141411 RepID=A0A7S3HY81_9SPIT|mmetsp:Transcript_17468/g.22118  ORF Transcript_17468/g.22118 Transcript_17468/m.22118 type:complete len:111 (+) Transcript_17468:41-373(+)